MPPLNLQKLSAFALAGGISWVAGCAGPPAPLPPQDLASYTVDDSVKFVLLDRAALGSVSCTGLQERTLADGRLDVVANIKNQEDHRVEMQVQCVFKDSLGFSTGDETPWQTLILEGNSTEAVRFTALNTLAHRYTIRVRQAR